MVVRSLAAACALFTCAFLAAASARAAVDVQVSVEDGTVYVDGRATGLFAGDLDEALRSGLPARVSVELALYERRAGLFDREVRRASWSVSVVFDLLDEIYSVLDGSGEPLMETADLAEVEEFVSGFDLWPLCAVGDLDPGRGHTLDVEFTVQPLSIDEVRDLERWLRGNVREGGRLRDVPGQLVGILRNRLGLGGRAGRGHSEEFRTGDLQPPR